jgi:allantoicase
MVARVWTVEPLPDHHLLPHGGEVLPSRDASSAPAAAVPCVAAMAAAGGTSAVSETKIELLLDLLRQGRGQRRGGCWGRLGRRRGGALRRWLAWRLRSSPRVNDVVEDGGWRGYPVRVRLLCCTRRRDQNRRNPYNPWVRNRIKRKVTG